MIDICILTAGRFDLLEKCLESVHKDLEHSGIDAEVYLLDNGSKLSERQNYQHLFQHPMLTEAKRLGQNGGFPVGANAAIKMGKNELVFFITDDIKLFPGAISSLVNVMKDKTIGICGLKLIFPLNGSSPNGPAGKVQHVGVALDIHGNAIHQFIGWSSTNSKVTVTEEVFAVTGATFMVRRSLFNRVRGFDEVYGLGTWEDIDLCLKLRSLGSKIYIDAGAMAEHYVGATAEKYKTPFPLQRNAEIFRSRWMDTHKVQWNDWLRR